MKMQGISGNTRLIPLIGHPVAQVKSPPAFNAYFAENDIDTVIVPLDIATGAVPAFFDNLRHWGNCAGCSVTVPHKQQTALSVDRISDRARLAGAVNIVRRADDGMLSGDMTDGLAMVAAIRSTGFRVEGCHALVAGAGGGAGAAIVHALAEGGIDRLTLVEPDIARLKRVRKVLERMFPQVIVTQEDDTAPVDLLVNATPLGMFLEDPLPFDPAGHSQAGIVADVVTGAAETKLVGKARTCGMRVVTGQDMIDRQLPFQMRHLGYPVESVPS